VSSFTESVRGSRERLPPICAGTKVVFGVSRMIGPPVTSMPIAVTPPRSTRHVPAVWPSTAIVTSFEAIAESGGSPSSR
jgi:hypothetical protein